MIPQRSYSVAIDEYLKLFSDKCLCTLSMSHAKFLTKHGS